jgi:hypothetical protein
MEKKILTAYILACFLLIVPVVNASNYDKNIPDEKMENPRINTRNDNKEIISYVYGDSLNVGCKGMFFIYRDVEMYTQYPNVGGIHIRGFMHPTEENNYQFYYDITTDHTAMSLLIGLVWSSHFPVVFGVAIGDIYYE